MLSSLLPGDFIEDFQNSRGHQPAAFLGRMFGHKIGVLDEFSALHGKTAGCGLVRQGWR